MKIRASHTDRPARAAVLWLPVNFLIVPLIWFLSVNLVTAQSADSTAKDLHLHRIDSLIHYQWLNDHVEILYENERSYQLNDLGREEVSRQFKPYDAGDFPFPAGDSMWCRVSLVNNLDHPVIWYIGFHQEPDSIHLFVVGEAGEVDSFKVGRYVRPENVENGSEMLKTVYDSKMPVLLTLEKGVRKDIYYKAYAPGTFQWPTIPGLYSAESIYMDLAGSRTDYVKNFFYLGLIWMFLLYNLLIFIFYREKNHLLLALYILCFALPNYPNRIVFLYKTWFTDFPLLLDFRWVFLDPLVFVTIALFMRSYLNSKKNYPRTHLYTTILLVAGLAYFVANVGSYFLLGSTLPAVLSFMSLLAGVLLVLVIIDLYKYRSSAVRFWLAGMAFLFILHIPSTLFGLLGLEEWNEAYIEFFMPISSTGIGVLGQIVIFTLGVGYRSREIADEKKQLEERDELKSRFFANISHEFRTPLTLVMGPLKQVMEKTADPADRQLLQMAHRNATRQLQLINQLLELSKLEAGKMKLQAAKADVVPVLKGIVNAYESLAVQQHKELTVKCPDGPLFLYFEQDKFEKIFYNLLSNAFKFTEPGGRITVLLKKTNNHAVVAVKDDGIGISKERLPNIFDRFFQSESGSSIQEGSGIGLALVREMVQLHGGKVEVESEIGTGTTFRLQFPLGKAHLDPEEIVRQPAYIRPAKETGTPAVRVAGKPPKNKLPADAPRLLIIDDNDDMRAFIRQYLDQSYRVTEAIDGEAGVRQALDDMPDLIVSDVMMPRKDGYEVCRELKSDIRTCHIPVILLTAKAAQEEKLEGLETGADDYLVKPFDGEELLVRIQNLIRLRQQLRERFADSITLQPSELTLNSLDREFLEKAMKVVEDNIENEAFNIEVMAGEMNMSKPNLNRKLRALVNKSTNQFIQSVRLQRAASMLGQNAGTVSEIGFRTGFSSTAYFVKCFKDQFGITPGAYKNQANENLN